MARPGRQPLPDASKLGRLSVKADVGRRSAEKTSQPPRNFKDAKLASKPRAATKITIGSVDGVAFEGDFGEDYPLVLGSNSFRAYNATGNAERRDFGQCDAGTAYAILAGNGIHCNQG